MAESGPGKIILFEDFTGQEKPVGNTDTTGFIGPFRIVGETLADTDAGIVNLESDGLNGIAQLTSPNADNDSIGLTTSVMFDVGLMGTLVAETRVRLADLDTKEVFFGFSNVVDDTAGLEGKIIHGASTTLTLSASASCGFMLSSELTEDEMWHRVFNGGTTTGITSSTAAETGVDAVAGEFDVLRLEIDTNGTARYWVNGDLNATVVNAVSTSVDLALALFVEIKGTGAVETIDCDYLLVKASRDWTR